MPELEPIRQPLVLRAVNSAAGALRRLGIEIASLEPASLMRAAVREAGLSDFGPGDFERGLGVIALSLESDARLTPIGRKGLRDFLINALVTRLQRTELRRTRPELFESELVPPLMLIGLPRSGTTLLHRLLALAPEARALRYYEVRHPIAPAGHDDRRERARREHRGMGWLAPGLDAKHFSAPDEAEECLFLFDSTMVSSSFWVAAPAYRYLEWYVEQDQRIPYRQYREHLQIFQAEQPTRRLTLKAPIHTANLGALLEAIPNVKLVQLHRDPAAALNSVNSLFYTLHRAVTDELDLSRLGRANFEFLARGIERNLEARKALAAERIVDVYYDELLADPLGVVRRIREHHGLGFDSEYAARIGAFMRDNPQHKHGKHRYSAADFGLDDREIRTRLAGYLEQFPGLLRDGSG
jgi:hypothetical protein